MPHINLSFHQGPEETLDPEALSQALTEIVTKKLGVESQYVSITIQPVAKEDWSVLVIDKYINQSGYQVVKPVTY